MAWVVAWVAACSNEPSLLLLSSILPCRCTSMHLNLKRECRWVWGREQEVRSSSRWFTPSISSPFCHFPSWQCELVPVHAGKHTSSVVAEKILSTSQFTPCAKFF